MTNKIIQFLAVKYPLPIFGISGIAILCIGLVMLVNLLKITEPSMSLMILTMSVCICGIVLILTSIILFALSELRYAIQKEKWYNS